MELQKFVNEIRKYITLDTIVTKGNYFLIHDTDMLFAKCSGELSGGVLMVTFYTECNYTKSVLQSYCERNDIIFI